MKFNTKNTAGNIRSKYRGCYAIYIKQLFAQTSPGQPIGDYEYRELQTLQELLENALASIE
jgi:cystathionine beta-lyase